MRQIFILTMLLTINFLSSCSTSTINPSQSKETDPPSLSSSNSILWICPDQHIMPEQFPLRGKLIYREYPSQYVLSFPEFVKTEFSHMASLHISISPNNHYLVTVNERFDEKTNSTVPYLDVIDFNEQIVMSVLWEKDWPEGDPTWIDNEKIIIRTSRANELAIYNPFSDTFYSKVFDIPSEYNMRIVAVDPQFKVVAYIYSTYNNVNDFGLNSLRVWDEEKEKEILDLKDEFSSLVSDIEFSNNEKLMAITTVTPKENQHHSEILVVDVDGGTYTQISDFRRHFEEILISAIQWSLDDKTIYFLAAVNGEKNELYSLDIQTRQLTHFCFQGLMAENLIVWVPDSPGFYFVIDSTRFAHSDKDEWDVLLVDSNNNKSYIVAENISLSGWLTPKK